MARAVRETTIEVYPEADRLEPFPHPRATRQLIGHVDAALQLSEAIASGRSHHAWLMTGPQGIGKATLAWRAACFALADQSLRKGAEAPLALGDGAAVAQLKAQVAALSHPGLLLIRRPYDIKDKRFKTVITVEEVRRLRGFMGHTVSTGGWRVVIVDPVDDLNIAAANALLKTLEEPPVRTLFFLVCAEPGRLLPTVRSRCRQLVLQPLSPQQSDVAARQAAERADAAIDLPEDAAWQRLVSIAGGSPRRLLTLAQGGGAELIAAIDAVFARLPRVDWPAAERLADDLSPVAQAVRFDLFHTLLLERMSRVARGSCGASPGHSTPETLADPDRVLAQRLAASGSLASWAQLWETLVRDKAAVDSLNLERRTFILGTLQKLAEVSGLRPQA